MMTMPSVPKDMLYSAPGSAAEHRLKVQQEAQERAALRASELAAQVSPERDVEERIRIWEHLHALRLPRASGHALIKVIATQTQLTVGQVQEEQRRRAATGTQSKAPQRSTSIFNPEPAQRIDPATLPRVFT
jgi:hypothetical protein